MHAQTINAAVCTPRTLPATVSCALPSDSLTCDQQPWDVLLPKRAGHQPPLPTQPPMDAAAAAAACRDSSRQPTWTQRKTLAYAGQLQPGTTSSRSRACGAKKTPGPRKQARRPPPRIASGTSTCTPRGREPSSPCHRSEASRDRLWRCCCCYCVVAVTAAAAFCKLLSLHLDLPWPFPEPTGWC